MTVTSQRNSRSAFGPTGVRAAALLAALTALAERGYRRTRRQRKMWRNMGVVPSRVVVALAAWLAVMGSGAAARAQQQEPVPDTGVIATPSTPAAPSADPAPDPAPSPSPKPTAPQMQAKRQFYVPPTASAGSGTSSTTSSPRPTNSTPRQPVTSTPATHSATVASHHRTARRKHHATTAKKAPPRYVPIRISVPAIRPLVAPADPSSSDSGDQGRRLALAGIALLTLALASGALLSLTVRMHRGRPRT